MEKTFENESQNKKSLILYLDQLVILDELSNEEAGILFKTIAHFVHTGEDLELDKLLKLAYIPIKQSLKRDLKKWREVKQVRSENGKLGGRPKNLIKAKKANGSFEKLKKLSKAKKAVNVNVNVNANVKDINIREHDFNLEVLNYNHLYNIEMLNSFFNYWSEFNEKKTKMRFELQKTWDTKKRLVTWKNNNFGSEKTKTKMEINQERMIEHARKRGLYSNDQNIQIAE